MGVFKRSWRLFTKSLATVRAQKKLLVFPLLSASALCVLLALVGLGGVAAFRAVGGVDGVEALFGQGTPAVVDVEAGGADGADGAEAAVAPVLAGADAGGAGSGAEWAATEYALVPGAVHDPDPEALSPAAQAAFIGGYFLLYLLFMFVANFCNVAFYSQIIGYIGGGTVSVRAGFAFALSRLKAVFLWSLFAATVGMLLKMLEERFGWLGRIVIRLIGLVWAVASAFAIPALVCETEGANPIDALKKSAATIKKTWGEALVGFAGFGAVSTLAALLFFVMAIGLMIAGVLSGSGVILALCGAAVGLGFLALVAVLYLVETTQHVYRAALYLYANGLPRPAAPYDDADYLDAFKRKKGK